MLSYIPSGLVNELLNLSAITDWRRNAESGMSSSDLRDYFFSFVQGEEFQRWYFKAAAELAGRFEIPLEKMVVQNQPTPRIMAPGDYGTGWHTDFWFGHGKTFRTVWVPVLGVNESSSFAYVNSSQQNQYLIDKVSANPYLLFDGLDLNGISIESVAPPESCFVVFPSDLLHGSVVNSSEFLRLSFDFRFGLNGDQTSTKARNNFLKVDGNKLVPIVDRHDGRFLKYVCGGERSTLAQHILINELCSHRNIEIVAQEAEIERYDFPMIRMHAQRIHNNQSRFDGIAVATKELFSQPLLVELRQLDVPIFFALEECWLAEL